VRKRRNVHAFDIPSYLELVEEAAELVRYWNAVSKGALQLVCNAYPPTVQLTQTAAELVPMSGWAIGDAIIQAAPPSADLGNADIFIGLVNSPCGGAADGNRVITGTYQEVGQRGWQWCSKCLSLGF